MSQDALPEPPGANPSGERPAKDGAALDEAAAAAFLKVSPEALARMRRARIGPRYALIGSRSAIYFERDLADWRESTRTGEPIHKREA